MFRKKFPSRETSYQNESGEYVRMFMKAVDVRDIEAFLSTAIKEAVEESRKDEMKFLRRMKLEFDVVVCICGEEWKDTDGADLINERIKTKLKNHKEAK